MNNLTLFRVALLTCAALGTPTASCSENQPVIVFPNHARLVMSAPVPASLIGKFGPGWTQLAFVRPDGATTYPLSNDRLTTDGGIVFSAPRDEPVSADGRYVVIDLTRNGVLDSGDGKPTVTGRQYCPILDTTTACVTRDETGDICGGKWDAKHSAWLDVVGTGEMQPMSRLEKPTAEAIWTQYSRSTADGITGYLDVVHGIDNLKACDPPNASNAQYYARIEAALEAAAHSMDQAPQLRDGVPTNAAHSDRTQTWTIKSNRAWLYTEPSASSSRRGYLIPGDHVTAIGTESGEWLHIRYERTGKPAIEAWLQRRDVWQ